MKYVFWAVEQNIRLTTLYICNYSFSWYLIIYPNVSTLKEVKWLLMLMVTKLTITSKNGKNKILKCDCNIALTFMSFSFKSYVVLWYFCITEYLEKLHFSQNNKESQTLCLCSLIACSQTAPLKWMVSSEPNSIKEEAISKSQFYYTATCLTPLNILRFVGTNIVSNNLEQSWAHEYSMAVLQMLPVKTFFTNSTQCTCFSLSSDFHQGFIPLQGQLVAGAAVDNYGLITEV